MKTIQIKVYNDPGHGWGAVKRSLLCDLGLENRISHFSYQKGKTVYLEEDCDLSLFVGTLMQRNIPYRYSEHFTDKRSHIRSYDHYTPEGTL